VQVRLKEHLIVGLLVEAAPSVIGVFMLKPVGVSNLDLLKLSKGMLHY
jgi:hypothetical protein